MALKILNKDVTRMFLFISKYLCCLIVNYKSLFLIYEMFESSPELNQKDPLKKLNLWKCIKNFFQKYLSLKWNMLLSFCEKSILRWTKKNKIFFFDLHKKNWTQSQIAWGYILSDLLNLCIPCFMTLFPIFFHSKKKIHF